MKKISKYFRHLSKIFDFQKTINLFSHKSYDYKIEFFNDNNTLFRSRIYSLFELKLKKLKKYLEKNLQKKFIVFNQTINYVCVWIILDSIILRNAIDISFLWSKKLWSKCKIASIWSSWTSYRFSTNFEWMKRMKNSSRSSFSWNHTSIEYYFSNWSTTSRIDNTIWTIFYSTFWTNSVKFIWMTYSFTANSRKSISCTFVQCWRNSRKSTCKWILRNANSSRKRWYFWTSYSQWTIFVWIQKR